MEGVLGEYYQILVLVAVIGVIAYWMNDRRNLPPGPWRILGIIRLMKDPKQGHLPLTRLSEKYGNISSLYLGNTLVIMLGDYKALKEAFVNQGVCFSGKPKINALFDEYYNGGLSITEGEIATQHRRFIISCMKTLGLGKSTFEQNIMVEIKCFLNKLKETNGQPTDLKFILGLTMVKIIALLEFGNELDDTKHNLDDINQFLEKVVDIIFGISKKPSHFWLIRTFLPWVKHIPFIEKIVEVKHLSPHMKYFHTFLHNMIKEKEQKHIQGSTEDYMDCYITERKLLLEKKGDVGHLTLNELLCNSQVLFFAGIETSVTYMLWAIIYMLKYPNVRKKVQCEIDEVIGKERDPVIADKRFMIYTEATLLELHRICSIVPMSILHSNMDETTLFGYHIPKRSCILANLWAIHHDPSLWKDPYEFKPERFINEDGKIMKPDYLIPFSIGKRNCLAETLANTSSFLTFVSLFQKFDVQLPKGDSISLESELCASLQPKPFKVCLFPY